MSNYSKIYITTTEHMSGMIYFSDVTKKHYITNPLVNYELTRHNPKSEYLSSLVFNQTLKDDLLIAINEYGQQIDALDDIAVDINNATYLDGQAPVWDNDLSKFVPQTISSGGAELPSISDYTTVTHPVTSLFSSSNMSNITNNDSFLRYKLVGGQCFITLDFDITLAGTGGSLYIKLPYDFPSLPSSLFGITARGYDFQTDTGVDLISYGSGNEWWPSGIDTGVAVRRRQVFVFSYPVDADKTFRY